MTIARPSNKTLSPPPSPLPRPLELILIIMADKSQIWHVGIHANMVQSSEPPCAAPGRQINHWKLLESVEKHFSSGAWFCDSKAIDTHSNYLWRSLGEREGEICLTSFHTDEVLVQILWSLIKLFCFIQLSLELHRETQSERRGAER